MECYGFFEDLKKEWPKAANLLYIPCDPNDIKDNENQKRRILDCFEQVNLLVKEVVTLREDDASRIKELISWADVIYLAGGHAPTQLAFMNRIGLKKALLTYNGIVIGLSAGSINAAYNV